MSVEELKDQLACGIRMLERNQHIDFNGHFSARIPNSEHILINHGASSRSSLTKDDIITIDLHGHVVEGDGEPPNEFPLHTHIYKKRKDVQAIAHTHPRWSTMFTIARVPLRPVVIQGAVLGEIPVFPKANSISNSEIAEKLATTLGDKNIALMKAHGAVIVGEGIIETFVRSVYLEENAYRQYMASQLGNAYSLTEEEIELMAKFLWQPKIIKKVWDNNLSKLMNGI
jgi:L-ribulose-5-phosphate 4-epimerase